MKSGMRVRPLPGDDMRAEEGTIEVNEGGEGYVSLPGDEVEVNGDIHHIW